MRDNGTAMCKADGNRVDGSRHAYAFYATNDRYAVAVLVAINLLKRLGASESIHFVVLHLSVSRYLLARMHEMGVTTKMVEKTKRAYGRYFRDCLVKLRVLQLTEYDRVVYLDADAIPLCHFDSLFDEPFDEKIAAPRAYWLEQPLVTSLLMVVKPSSDLWNRVERHFDTALEERIFDMEIVNREFDGAIHVLPNEYACLDSEWEDVGTSFHFGNPDTSLRSIKLVHFSAFGKPWSISPRTVRRRRPNAHPTFIDLWQRWWAAREEVFEGCSLPTRVWATVLKHWSINRLYGIRPLARRIRTVLLRTGGRPNREFRSVRNEGHSRRNPNDAQNHACAKMEEG